MTFPEGIAELLKEATADRNYEQEILLLAKATKICRRDEFAHSTPRFNGTFSQSCQQSSVSGSTKHLMSMLLYGTSVRTDDCYSQECLTISQLVRFNMKKRGKMDAKNKRHNLDYEPPLPV